MAARLITDFDSINDPYVVERLYAVAFGVAAREGATPGLRALAVEVYQHVFSRNLVRPHILLRDYAQAVLESALMQKALPDSISPTRFRPPFKSKWPNILPAGKARAIEKSKGWSRIAFSVRPEGMGMYGDFGRYVMGSSVHYFLNTRKGKPVRGQDSRRSFDDRVAHRYVLQRVRELGWKPQDFGGYEDHLPTAGRHEDDEFKVERISKKYQWIALHELLGYLSDHYYLKPNWSDEGPRAFSGTWELYAREFDPSLPEDDTLDKDDRRPTNPIVDPSSQASSAGEYPDPFEDVELCARRVDWVEKDPAGFRPLILYPHLMRDLSAEWVALDGFWSWREPEYQVHRLGGPGRLKMWAHLRSWLVSDDKLALFLKRVRQIHFYGHGCHGVTLGDGWIGEYPWGSAYSETRRYCTEPDRWIENVGVAHIRTTCDWDRRDGFTVPSPQLCDLLSLRWSGRDANFTDAKNRIAAFQTGRLGDSDKGPSVVRLDLLRDALRSERSAIVWAVLGERDCWDGNNFVGNKRNEFSAVYSLGPNGIRGGLTQRVIQTFRHDRDAS